MYNRVILVGNLTRDIEMRYAQSGTAIAKTAIATSRKFTSNGERKEETMFIDITFFGRSAEIANQYLRKGSKVLIEGRLQFEQWQDQNGQKRSKHSVIVENMQMLDSRGDTQNMQQGTGSGYNQPQQSYNQSAPSYQQSNQPSEYAQNQGYTPPQQSYQQPKRQEAPQQNSVPEIDIDDDEIPF